MARADFTKTSAQVEREIIQLIDSVDRSLDSSNSESERKGQVVLTGFLSICVFAAIWAFQMLVADSGGQVVEPSGSLQNGGSSDGLMASIDGSALRLIDINLKRISEQVEVVRSVKDRVAPSMPIDGSLDAIKNSSNDARGLLGIQSDPGG